MKTYPTTITDRGQVSIPAPIRKSMYLEPGRKLSWEQISENEVRVMLVKEEPDPLKVLGYGPNVRAEKPRRTDDWMREIREGEEI